VARWHGVARQQTPRAVPCWTAGEGDTLPREPVVPVRGHRASVASKGELHVPAADSTDSGSARWRRAPQSGVSKLRKGREWLHGLVYSSD
jgi:hypothetical protein